MRFRGLIEELGFRMNGEVSGKVEEESVIYQFWEEELQGRKCG